MHYTSQYPSPLGELLLAADDDGLTGVWFVGQKYFARSLAPDSVAREIPLFAQVKQWLALYFAGQEPELEIPIHIPQAVGGAVGHNPISILIPCHRVVGTNGSLTGYAGGLDRKVKLLTLEKAEVGSLFLPKRGTAL